MLHITDTILCPAAKLNPIFVTILDTKRLTLANFGNNFAAGKIYLEIFTATN